MIEYKQISDTVILRLADNTCIPVVEGNKDYIAYQDYVANGGTVLPPDPPAVPVPSQISDRQFFQQLAVAGIITQDDALNAVRVGAIPAPMQALVDALPANQQFAAKMLISGATVFERHHPMTETIGAAYGWNASQIDAFFTAAAEL